MFLPGFSTADRVTQFSGRGVGMDVVRTNIEKIGGTVDIESPPGQGTTVRTKIPLTLAIIPALIIVSGGERYAIPQVSLLELMRLDAEQASRGIERIHGAPVYRLRGNLLPLVFLDEQLRLAATRGAAEALNIVVLQADDRPFGLVIDEIRDTEEIVVKPLQKQLKGVSVFAGAAIMGDGRVALVLDVLGLAQRAGVISGAKSRAFAEQERPEPAAASEGRTLLLFASRGGGQMAIPLSLVARLEELPRASLVSLGARQVVQYRGEILPLVDVSQELDCLRLGGHFWDPSRRDDAHDEPSDTVPVVVYAADNQRVRPDCRPDSRYCPGPGCVALAGQSARRPVYDDCPGPGHGADRCRGPGARAQPPILLRRPRSRRNPPAETNMTASRQFCTVYLGDQCFGLDVLKVQEIVRHQPLTPVPLAHPMVRGLINLRGQIVTAIELRERLELPPRPENLAPVNVVVETDDGAVSLLVDEIGDVLEVTEDQFEPPPETLQGAARDLIHGAYKLPDRLLIILDPELIVALPGPRN